MPGNPFYQSSFWKALRKACLERDRYRCAVPGCRNRAAFADHFPAPHPRGATGPTPADALTNLRSLCPEHDAQVKEGRDGSRRNGGAFTVRGCDADGMPIDPSHPWARTRAGMGEGV